LLRGVVTLGADFSTDFRKLLTGDFEEVVATAFDGVFFEWTVSPTPFDIGDFSSSDFLRLALSLTFPERIDLAFVGLIAGSLDVFLRTRWRSSLGVLLST